MSEKRERPQINSERSGAFQKVYKNKLTQAERALTDKTFDSWVTNPWSGSLGHILLVQNPPIGRVEVGDHFRAIYGRDPADGCYVWFWLNTHEEYNKICGKKTLLVKMARKAFGPRHRLP